MAASLPTGPTLMAQEAAQAGAAVRAQLELNRTEVSRAGELLRRLSPRLVVTCARGSSDHAATFAKYLIERKTGVPTASAAPSMASVYAAPLKLEGALCLAVSQSGKSPDLLATAAAAKAAGALVIALVNDGRSPLAEAADVCLPLEAGLERSVAATKSYVAALAAMLQLVAAWTEDADLTAAVEELPVLLDRAWALDWSGMLGPLRDAQSAYVIGRGTGLGIAQEGALKLKETSLLHAEAFSAAEVRHGPMALVRPGFPMLVFRQEDDSGSGVDELAADMVAQGADVMIAGAEVAGAVTLPTLAAHPELQPLLQILSFYRAASALALARGLDPDAPPHLAKVTETR